MRLSIAGILTKLSDRYVKCTPGSKQYAQVLIFTKLYMMSVISIDIKLCLVLT